MGLGFRFFNRARQAVELDTLIGNSLIGAPVEKTVHANEGLLDLFIGFQAFDHIVVYYTHQRGKFKPQSRKINKAGMRYGS